MVYVRSRTDVGNYSGQTVPFCTFNSRFRVCRVDESYSALLPSQKKCLVGCDSFYSLGASISRHEISVLPLTIEPCREDSVK
jgi:hypothetical protein